MALAHLLLRKELLGPQKLLGVDGTPVAESLILSRRSRFMRRLSTFDFGGQLLFLCRLGH